MQAELEEEEAEKEAARLRRKVGRAVSYGLLPLHGSYGLLPLHGSYGLLLHTLGVSVGDPGRGRHTSCHTYAASGALPACSAQPPARSAVH